MKPNILFLPPWHAIQVIEGIDSVLKDHARRGVKVTIDDLAGPSRKAPICAARQECAWVLRLMDYTLQDIATILRR